MLPTMKVYKIDYDFIINNYLDRRLWKKTWNLFVYKDNIFTINLSKIDTENDCIEFKVKYNKRIWDYEQIKYYIDGRVNIAVLLKEINGAIFRLMCNYEEELIRKTPGYGKILDAREREKELLRDIANDFLDSNSVTNEEIREAYICKYVDDNLKMDDNLSDYIRKYRYNYLTDMLLIYTKAIKDTTREEIVKNAFANKTGLAIIEKTVDAFLEEMETSDYAIEMEAQLENI